MNIRALGAQLRSAGLSPRGLEGWIGTDRISAIPTVLPARISREPVPAAVALTLFVGGIPLTVAHANNLPLDDLIAAKLVISDGTSVQAPQAVLPIGPSLMVCDHFRAPDAVERVSWPDDSSLHLVGALGTRRRRRWLDLGAGSAFAQLARPNLADAMIGIDLNPRAAQLARLGTQLSGADRIQIKHVGVDTIDGVNADLVTCNAPLPEAVAVDDVAMWRRAPRGFFPALWPAIRRNLTEGGEAIVHVAPRMIPADLPGERVIVSYAPDLAVLWWRPDEPDLVARGERTLTPDRPHLDDRDRDAALDDAP